MTGLLSGIERPVRHWSCRDQARDGALDAVRWLAILAMTIDHICNVLSPRLDGLYPLMRVLVPYAFYWIAAFHALRLRADTPAASLPWRNLALLAGFALASQIPYEFAFARSGSELNMLWTLALGQVLLWGVVTRNPLLAAAAMLPALALEVVGPRLCYGAAGVVVPSIIWLAFQARGWLKAPGMLLTAAALFVSHMPLGVTRNFLLGHATVWPGGWVDYRFAGVALLSVWAVPAAYRWLSQMDWHLWVGPRWFFHAYYGAHLVPVALLRWVAGVGVA